MFWVKHWEYKLSITFKLCVCKCEDYMNRFILKNTFIKVYLYHFLINIFIKPRRQSCVLETVSLSKTTSFTRRKGVHARIKWLTPSTISTIQNYNEMNYSTQGKHNNMKQSQEQKYSWKVNLNNWKLDTPGN